MPSSVARARVQIPRKQGIVLTTMTRMARAGLTEEVLCVPDFKEDWEVRPASSSYWPVS